MTRHAIHTRVTCAHMDITGVTEAYCSLCVAETMAALGCDEPTAKFAIALDHGWTKGDICGRD